MNNETNMKFEKIGKEIVDLLEKKNADYGDMNLCRHGLKGIIVRIDDKTARIDNLIKKDNITEVNESIEDTLKDIAGYCINAIRLLRDKKI